jgi:hypothetical protein
MTEHYCEFVILFEGDQDAYGNPVDEVVQCGKVAHFKDELDSWWCADHYDELMDMANIQYVEGQGVCRICNCEFFNGECNCSS